MEKQIRLKVSMRVKIGWSWRIVRKKEKNNNNNKAYSVYKMEIKK